MRMWCRSDRASLRDGFFVPCSLFFVPCSSFLVLGAAAPRARPREHAHPADTSRCLQITPNPSPPACAPPCRTASPWSRGRSARRLNCLQFDRGGGGSYLAPTSFTAPFALCEWNLRVVPAPPRSQDAQEVELRQFNLRGCRPGRAGGQASKPRSAPAAAATQRRESFHHLRSPNPCPPACAPDGATSPSPVNGQWMEKPMQKSTGGRNGRRCPQSTKS